MQRAFVAAGYGCDRGRLSAQPCSRQRRGRTFWKGRHCAGGAGLAGAGLKASTWRGKSNRFGGRRSPPPVERAIRLRLVLLVERARGVDPRTEPVPEVVAAVVK